MDSLQEAASPLPPFLQLLLLSGGSLVWGGDWESWKCCAPPTRSWIPLWTGGLAWVWHLRQKIRLLPWALLSRCLPTDLRLALKPLSVCLVLSLAEAWGTHLPPSKTSALGSHPYHLPACLFCKLPPNICLCPTRGYGSSSGNICWVVIQTEYSWQMLCDIQQVAEVAEFVSWVRFVCACFQLLLFSWSIYSLDCFWACPCQEHRWGHSVAHLEEDLNLRTVSFYPEPVHFSRRLTAAFITSVLISAPKTPSHQANTNYIATSLRRAPQ